MMRQLHHHLSILILIITLHSLVLGENYINIALGPFNRLNLTVDLALPMSTINGTSAFPYQVLFTTDCINLQPHNTLNYKTSIETTDVYNFDPLWFYVIKTNRLVYMIGKYKENIRIWKLLYSPQLMYTKCLVNMIIDSPECSLSDRCLHLKYDVTDNMMRYINYNSSSDYDSYVSGVLASNIRNRRSVEITKTKTITTNPVVVPVPEPTYSYITPEIKSKSEDNCNHDGYKHKPKDFHIKGTIQKRHVTKTITINATTTNNQDGTTNAAHYEPPKVVLSPNPIKTDSISKSDSKLISYYATSDVVGAMMKLVYDNGTCVSIFSNGTILVSNDAGTYEMKTVPEVVGCNNNKKDGSNGEAVVNGGPTTVSKQIVISPVVKTNKVNTPNVNVGAADSGKAYEYNLYGRIKRHAPQPQVVLRVNNHNIDNNHYDGEAQHDTKTTTDDSTSPQYNRQPYGRNSLKKNDRFIIQAQR